MKAKTVILAAIAAAIVLGEGAAFAYSPTDLVHLHPTDSVRPPIGWVQFCQSNPEECKSSARDMPPVQLTREKLRELERVNRHFNRTIQPMTDDDQYGAAELWTYANTAKETVRTTSSKSVAD